MTAGPWGRGTPTGEGRLGRAGAALLSFSAAVGVVVGARAVVALELPGVRSLLRFGPTPAETLGLRWTPRALWPDELQGMALERMAGVVAALFLMVAAVALLNTLVLLVEAGSARRREVAVRAAVGGAPGALLDLLWRQLRALVAAGVTLGVLLGMVGGGAVRSGWPGAADPMAWGNAAATVLPILGFLTALAAGAYLWVGVSVGRRAALAPILLTGGRVTADRGETFRLRALSAFQMGMAGAVALGALALARSAPAGEGASVGREDTVAVSVARSAGAAGWSHVLAALDEVEGLEAVSAASPGAVVGLGVRDNATAQCGNCYRGGLPLPLWGARADHHAVAPGFFDEMGLGVVAGRVFDAQDGPDAPRVAVVNRTFANTAFEKGEPVGRLLRLGRDLDGWYEVVGVVDDRDPVVMGRDDVARSVVYVSVTQHPLQRGEVLLRGTEDGVAAARGVLTAAGYAPGEARTLAEVGRQAAAPLVWMSRLALALGLLTLTLAMVGVHATAQQVTRRRVHELAVRRCLGATDVRIARHVLGGALRVSAGGVCVALFAGPLLVAFIRKTAGGVPPLGVGAFLALTALLVASGVLASLRSGRRALAVEPMEALEWREPSRLPGGFGGVCALPPTPRSLHDHPPPRRHPLLRDHPGGRLREPALLHPTGRSRRRVLDRRARVRRRA